MQSIGDQDRAGPDCGVRRDQFPLDPYAPFPPQVATKAMDLVSNPAEWRPVTDWAHVPPTTCLTDEYFHYER